MIKRLIKLRLNRVSLLHQELVMLKILTEY
nr:MAG TPA: hypothetical protein [Bacteriophage sp.]